MAGELARAYVQIIPSARGIASGIKQELGGEAKSAGNSFGKTLVGTIKKAIAAAGIGTAIKAALNEGGALQQSLGGVETLFKDDADTIKAYAEEAYKTAGVSANTYMEQVTSFSASLLQSMGGNTKAAAEIAHMAMVDMSDNANKFGTDIQDIQHAYQGFAKQNYTMLDNLKLGYGGTKSEMERLLKDAQKLTGVKYDLNNLNDVYTAIHVIQEEMGVTGTTALEASTTFTGSLDSMKAAAANLIGKLALGEDIMPPLKNLAGTAKTFFIENMLPMVGNVFSGIGKTAVNALLSSFGTDLETASASIRNMFAPVKDSVSELMDTLAVVTAPAREAFSAYIGSGQAASDVTGGIKTALENISGALATVITGFSDFVSWLNSGRGSAEAFKTILVSVVAAFATFKTITTVVGGVQKFIGVVKTVKTTLMGLWAVISANPATLIIAGIAGIVAGIMYLWKNCEGFRNFVTGLGAGIRDGFMRLKENWNNLTGKISEDWAESRQKWRDGWNEIKTNCKESFDSMKQTATEKFSAIKNTIGRGMQNAQNNVANILGNMKRSYEENGGGIQGVVSASMSGIRGIYETSFNGLDILTGGKLGEIRGKFVNEMTRIRSRVDSSLDAVKTKFQNVFDGARSIVQSAIEKIKGFFRFEWRLPELKLPHFSISGGFSLNPISVPKFNVEWFKDGAILSSATIFGSIGNRFLGGGEAGNEAVLPLSGFYRELERIIRMDRPARSSETERIVINVYATPGQDEQAIAQRVKEELYNDYRRREAALA